MKPKYFTLVIGLLLLSTYYIRLHASTCNATDWTTLTNCVSSSSNGDSISLAAGTYHATTTLTISKALTIFGPACTNGNTTKDGLGAPTACTAIISDEIASGIPFQVTLVASQGTRFHDMKFVDGGVKSSNYSAGFISAIQTGGNTDGSWMRVDHIWAYQIKTFFVQTDTVLGVQDHNTWDFSAPAYLMLSYNRNCTWNNQGTYGDGRFADDDNFGTYKWWFEENNYIIAYSAGFTTAVDGDCGGGHVYRYNTGTNGQINIDGHGPENGQRKRGCRGGESYNNTWFGNGISSNFVSVRCGTWIVHDESFTGFSSTNISMLNPRQKDSWPPTAFGGESGTSPYDSNDAGGVFTSGTLTSVTNTLDITDNTKSWTTNQYRGYSINRISGTHVYACSGATYSSGAQTITFTCNGHNFANGDNIGVENNTNTSRGYIGLWQTIRNVTANTFDTGDPNSGKGAVYTLSNANGTLIAMKGQTFAEVTGNNTTGNMTMNLGSNSIYGSAYNVQWEVGDGYSIRKVTAGIDMPGMGKGDLLTGDVPTGSANQAISPWYQWNNGSTTYSSDSYITVSGTHYISGTKPGYTAFTYPHPLITCGQLQSCGTSTTGFAAKRLFR